jgi:hypothetical protein
MNNSLRQFRVLRSRFTRLGGAAGSVTRAALLTLVVITVLCPLSAGAQEKDPLGAVRLKDAVANEPYQFSFADKVKRIDAGAEWFITGGDVPEGKLPNDTFKLSKQGTLTGTPTHTSARTEPYKFKVQAVTENEKFTITVLLRVQAQSLFDAAKLDEAGASFTKDSEPCKAPDSTFVLASSTADEETIALTEDASDETLAALNRNTLQILDADRLIQTTLGNGSAGPTSVFRKGDYTIINISRWKAVKADAEKTDPAKELWALYEFTDRGGGAGLGWVARMDPEDKQNFDTRIFGSRRVAVLLLHLQAPRTWDVQYTVDITKRVPQPIQNASRLLGFLGGAGAEAECEPPPTRNIWGGRLMLVRHTASDMVVKLNTVTATSGGDPISQSKEYSKKYLNEGRYHWDVSIGMPLKGIKELEFSAENGVVTAKKTERQNAYGFLNLFPRAVNLNGKSYLTSPHFVLGVPISGKPLDRPLVGVGTGFYTQQFKVNFFAGIAFNKVREPRTLAAGQAATEGQLESDLETRRVRKFVFGINFPVKQFIDAIKGSK